MDDPMRNEVLYGRDHDAARIFVSSRMNGTLDDERRVAAEAIGSVDGHRAWWWEADAPIGVLHSESECVHFAETSDGLVLLIAGSLSPIVKAEYEAARRGGGHRYILVREPDLLPTRVKQFVRNEQRTEVVTRNFRNSEELRTHIYNALVRSSVRALREQVLSRRSRSEVEE